MEKPIEMVSKKDVAGLEAYNEQLIKLVQGWEKIGKVLMSEVVAARKEMESALTVLKFSQHEAAHLDLQSADERLAKLVREKPAVQQSSIVSH